MCLFSVWVQTGEVPSALQSHSLVWLSRGYSCRTLFLRLPPITFVIRSSAASEWHEPRLVPAGKLWFFLTHLSIAHRAGAWRWRGQPVLLFTFSTVAVAVKAIEWTKRKPTRHSTTRSVKVWKSIIFSAYFADKLPPK